LRDCRKVSSLFFCIQDIPFPSFDGLGAKVGDYLKRLDNLNKKISIFYNPLHCNLKALISVT
jgi:hypothetical protein